MHRAWARWAQRWWPALECGRKVRVRWPLPHPADAGFTRLTIAEPHGQVADYAAALDDGSRLHVHVCPDGSWVVHRDRFDPGRSAGHAVLHVLTETRAGRAAMLLLAAAATLRRVA